MYLSLLQSCLSLTVLLFVNICLSQCIPVRTSRNSAEKDKFVYHQGLEITMSLQHHFSKWCCMLFLGFVVVVFSYMVKLQYTHNLTSSQILKVINLTANEHFIKIIVQNKTVTKTNLHSTKSLTQDKVQYCN